MRLDLLFQTFPSSFKTFFTIGTKMNWLFGLVSILLFSLFNILPLVLAFLHGIWFIRLFLLFRNPQDRGVFNTQIVGDREV
jgi:hypothetical protein